MTGRHHSEQIYPGLYLLGSLAYSENRYCLILVSIFTQHMYLLAKCFHGKEILFYNGQVYI